MPRVLVKLLSGSNVCMRSDLSVFASVRVGFGRSSRSEMVDINQVLKRNIIHMQQQVFEHDTFSLSIYPAFVACESVQQVHTHP